METQNIKTSLTQHSLRIAGIKNEIRDLGCTVRENSQDREIWVTHCKTGWRSYVRLPSCGSRWNGLDVVLLETIEECWRDALNIARQMDADWYSCD